MAGEDSKGNATVEVPRGPLLEKGNMSDALQYISRTLDLVLILLP